MTPVQSTQTKNSLKEHRGTTQKFIDIKNIIEDVVILSGGNACMVIQVTSSNFALLSKQEQDAKIVSYAALLNSLSFPIQIIVQNKRIDISSYVQLLNQEISKIQNEQFAPYARLYQQFVEELVKVNTVLDKKSYIVVSYSYLERGAGQAAASIKQKTAFEGHEFFTQAKEALATKATAVHSQLARVGLRSKTLEKDELVRLFYNIYNEDLEQAQQVVSNFQTPIVKGAQ